jgi:TolA-binding protein
MVRSNSCRWLVLASLLAGGLLLYSGCGPKKNPNTVRDIEQVKKEVEQKYKDKVDRINKKIAEVQAEREKKATDLVNQQDKLRADAIDGYEKFLTKYPDSSYTPDILIRLGEAYYEHSEQVQIDKELDYLKASEEYSKKVQAERETFLKNLGVTEDEYNKMKSPPPFSPTATLDVEEPKPSFEKTIKAYQEIVLRYKDFEYIDTAYYGLGICLESMNERKEAADTFNTLVTNIPNSKFCAECYLRIGNYYFDVYDFETAIKYYGKVDNKPENEKLYDKAIYKIGWCHYNLANDFNLPEYYSAIDSFCQLLDFYAALREKGQGVINSQQVELADEAERFSAICFTELAKNSSETAVELSKQYFAEHPETYAANIEHRLGDVYLYKQDKIKEAIDVYETLLADNPNYEKAAEVLTSVVEAYTRSENLADADRTRQRILDEYGPDSEWFKNLPDATLKTNALKQREINLHEVAEYNHQMALNAKQENNKELATEYFLKALYRYRQYLHEFPGNEKAYKYNFNLASVLYELEDYKGAAVEFERVSLEYTDPRYITTAKDITFTRSDAAYNAVVCYSKVFENYKGATYTDETKPIRKLENVPGSQTPESGGTGTTPEKKPEETKPIEPTTEQPPPSGTVTSPGGSGESEGEQQPAETKTEETSTGGTTDESGTTPPE